tara:strand:+ start:1246 stop:1596 length:351 start_codon:yes stop_codon:yes gene_type:complete
MDKHIQLLIRACKSPNALRRLLKIYSKVYFLGTTKENKKHLVLILSEICDEYCPMNTYELMLARHPENLWKLGLDKEIEAEEDIWLQIFISKIRLSHRDCFTGLTVPARFRGCGYE